MRALLWFAVTDSLLITCWAASQITSETTHEKGYGIEAPLKINNEKLLEYQNPDTYYNNLNVQDDYVKSLLKEYERRMRLKSLYESLAVKLQKVILNKIQDPNYKENIDNEKSNPLSTKNNSNTVTGRRNLVETVNKELHKVATVSEGENSSELDKSRRKLLKHLTYVVEDVPELSNFESGMFVNVGDETKSSHYISEPLQQGESGTRTGYTIITQNTVPFQTSVIRSNEKRVPKFVHWPSYYPYRQSFIGISNPFNTVYNTIEFPINKYVEFKDNIHLQYDPNEMEQIKTYLTEVMEADDYSNPKFLQILNEANALDLSKVERFDQSQLVKISKSDLESLKKYFILILNKYGITPYVFKLLEFINLAEGRPTNEIYLLYKILNDQRALYSLNELEVRQLTAHLQKMLSDYGTSPYIVSFVKNIGRIQIEPNRNNNLYLFDFGHLGPTSAINQDYTRKVYLHLSQIYNNNPFILKILQNLYRIYENYDDVADLPVLDSNDYYNLSYLNQNDLNLLAKYILEIIKQRGENAYLRQLLIYVHQLQGKFQFDLTRLQEYLLKLYHINGISQEVLEVLNRLLSKNVVELYNKEQINNDLIIIRNYLLQNQIPKLQPLLMEIVQQLNQAKMEPEQISPIVLLDDSQKMVVINVYQLEQIYQYLLAQQNVIPRPYFNEITQLIQHAIRQPYSNGLVQLKYDDLQKIYNLILLHEQDTGNPIYIKILHYLNQAKNHIIPKDHSNTITYLDLMNTSQIFYDNQINLDVIYKSLLSQVEMDEPNLTLLDLLQLINKTLISSNGELKIKIINLNSTEPVGQINLNDLEKIFIYLQTFTEDEALKNKLIEYIKTLKEKDEHNINVLSRATKESLGRIKNFLATFIKEQGEFPYVLRILFYINRVLGVPESTDIHLHVSNDTNSNVNEDDLDFLKIYLTEVNGSDFNSDVINILEYINETKTRIENERKRHDVSPLKLYILDIIYKDDINTAIKSILADLAIEIDDLNASSPPSQLESINFKRILDLNQRDIHILTKYILKIINKFGPNPRLNHLLNYIDQINEKYNKGTDSIIIYINNTVPNDENQNIKEEETVNITGYNVKIINKYLLDLINQYGEDSNVLHILYKINNINEAPGIEIDWTKLINNATNNKAVLTLEDVNLLIKYLLQLIQKQGANINLTKILRDIGELYLHPIKETNRLIVNSNGTHTMISLDRDDVDRIKSYLINLTKNYELNPLLVRILHVITLSEDEPSEKHYLYHKPDSNIYTFAKLNQNDLNQLTQYILGLIEEQGTRPEFIELLHFIYQIYGNTIKEDSNENPYTLTTSEEVKNLNNLGVIQILQDIDSNELIALYTNMLEKIFLSPSLEANKDLQTILRTLVDTYKKEASPVNKFILLNWYEYLLKNKGEAYKMFWNPEFIGKLLTVEDNGDTVKIIVPFKQYVVHSDNYYTNINDLRKLLEKLLRNPENKPIDEHEMVSNNTDNENNNNNSQWINEDYGKDVEDAVYVFDVDSKIIEDIRKALNDLLNLNQHNINLSKHELERMFLIFVNFMNKLKLERQGRNVPSSLLLEELENRLLVKESHQCHQQSNIPNGLTTTVVNSLRDTISYLKSNNIGNNEIMRIVKSTLIEDVMPDLNAVIIEECTTKTNEEILDSLYSIIFTDVYGKEDVVEIVSGYTVKGDADIQTLSTEELEQQIKKLKNFAALSEATGAASHNVQSIDR